MNRKHATVIAILIGIAAMLGAFAASRTIQLGASARSASQAQILARQQRLAKAEKALTIALRTHPAAKASAAPRTVYVRPAPIVIHKHSGGEHENEGGGGFND